MKKMILIFVGFFVLNLLSLAQNPVGILAPKYVKYDILGAPLIQNLPHPNFPDAYDEEPALGAQNIQMDGSGENILFFIIDSKVYDRNGKLMGVFYSDPDYDNRIGEVLVVPAGTCRNEFFVFGTREGNYSSCIGR